MVTSTINILPEERLNPNEGFAQDTNIDYVNSALKSKVMHELLLGTLSDGRFYVTSPIRVRFVTEDNHIIAEAEEFNEYGFGNTKSEAIRDLQKTIVELYLTLYEEQNRLGQDLLDIYSALQRKISLRS